MQGIFSFEMIFRIKTNLRRGFTISTEHYLQVRSGSYILAISLPTYNSENVNEQLYEVKLNILS